MAIHKIKVGSTEHYIEVGETTKIYETSIGDLEISGAGQLNITTDIYTDCPSNIHLGACAGDAYLTLVGDDATAYLCGYHGVSISGGGPNILVDTNNGIQLKAYDSSYMANIYMVAQGITMKTMDIPFKCIPMKSDIPAVECVYNGDREYGWVSLFPGVMHLNNPSYETQVGAHATVSCARPVTVHSSLSYMDLSALEPDGLWFSRRAHEDGIPYEVEATNGVYGTDLSYACGIMVNSGNPNSVWPEAIYNYGIDIVARANSEVTTNPEIRLIAENIDGGGSFLEFSPNVFRISEDINFTRGKVKQHLGTNKTFIGGTYTAIGSKACLANGTNKSASYCLSGYNPMNCVVIASGYGYLLNSASYANATSTSFIVVDGSSDTTRRNSLRVASGKLYLKTSYQSSGAGITELFEWLDGNPDNEDRVGHFVTLVGEKIRYAEPTDNYVVGAVDPLPSVVGDNGEVWHGMYKRDVFGRALKEKVFVPKEVDEEGNVLWEDHYEEIEIQGEDFDPEKQFIERWERQEYSTISSKGKVVLIDDGTCQVDKFATVGPGGIATHSDDNVAVRVMKRVDENHVKVFIDAAFLIKH